MAIDLRKEFQDYYNGLKRWSYLKEVDSVVYDPERKWYYIFSLRQKRKWIRELVFGIGLLLTFGLHASLMVGQDIDWKFTAAPLPKEKEFPLVKTRKEAYQKAVDQGLPAIGWYKMDPNKWPEIANLKAIHYKSESNVGDPALLISGGNGKTSIIREKNIGEDVIKKIKENWGTPHKDELERTVGIGEDLSKKHIRDQDVRPVFCANNVAEKVQMAKQIGKPILYYVDCVPTFGSEIEKFFLEFGDAENIMLADSESETGQGEGPRIVFCGKDRYHYYVLTKLLRDRGGKEIAKKVREQWVGWTAPMSTN